jgi:hypothetical protein
VLVAEVAEAQEVNLLIGLRQAVMAAAVLQGK